MRFFINLLLKNLHTDLCVSAMESQIYHGTDRQKRETGILKILRVCDSEWNAELVDVQCCADVLNHSLVWGWEVPLTHSP